MVFFLTGLLSLEFSFQIILACLHHCPLMRDQVNFQWDYYDTEVRFLLDQHA